MKNYELAYIVSPDISDQELEILIAKVTDSIREETGSVEKRSIPSKIKLGYLIKKKAEAFLVSTYFSLDQDRIANLEKNLKEQNDILRYMIVVKKKIKEKPGKIQAPQTFDKKVELKEIDQKIEEILQ